MGWIKISDEDGGVYAKEPDNDPEQIVSVAEIEAEIAELERRIASVHLIEVPKGASEEVATIVNEKNGNLIATEITPLQLQIERKQIFLDEVKNG